MARPLKDSPYRRSGRVIIGDRTIEGLREQIREARSETDYSVESPRLANLVGYYQLVDGAPEWPVDATSVLRFIGYLFLGFGSWLGGAVVERILDSAIWN